MSVGRELTTRATAEYEQVWETTSERRRGSLGQNRRNVLVGLENEHLYQNRPWI